MPRYIQGLLSSADEKKQKPFILIAQGNREAAKELFREVIKEKEEKLEPSHKELAQDYLDLALLELFDDYQEALRLLERAVVFDGNNLEALNQLGQLRLRLGKSQEAIDSFKKLRELAEEQG